MLAHLDDLHGVGAAGLAERLAHGDDDVVADLHRAALQAKDPALRRNAVRALGNDASSIALFFSSSVVSDADPTTKLAAFVKLAEFPSSQQIQTVATSIVRNPANQKDEWLREAVRISRAEGLDGVLLEVRPSNAVARRLYASEGFREVHVRRGYYPSAEGREDAILMALPLPLHLLHLFHLIKL